MGLTAKSSARAAVDGGLVIERKSPDDRVIALAGNPNVGKSTVFNALTGMNQHTGNWPGKTVASASGRCESGGRGYIFVDIPGTYSLMAHSAEEEVARGYICFGEPDATVVVCDATCLERNMNLVLQTMEISSRVVVCVNLLDEAERKNITIDLARLGERLGVPVVGTVARKKKSLNALLRAVDRVVAPEYSAEHMRVRYPDEIERAVAEIEPHLAKYADRVPSRWLALKLIEGDDALIREAEGFLGDRLSEGETSDAVERAWEILDAANIDRERLKDLIVASLVTAAASVCVDVVGKDGDGYSRTDRKLDRVLTSKRTGYPIMLLLLGVVFWLTMVGANYPSELLSRGLFWVQDRLTDLFMYIHAPDWLHGLLVLGVYRTLAWVVSVMLPPMAIFFPLFTLLEDSGYLPRIAYNLDRPFKRCAACGKQALTMCMGFGCNAAGVIGCRIIDSPRERLLAILTNSLVPCNGRFPTLIAMLAMFFAFGATGLMGTLTSALGLTAAILMGVLATLGMTKLLSATLLKGEPSSFTLELPPYRRPQVGKVIVRSIFDRTLFVLGRAAAVAAPAGAVIWLLANVTIGDASLLNHCASFLDPFARLMGLDGVILLAFILGFPANEIVVPVIIMAYMAQGSLLELGAIGEMKELFAANGWTWVTAASVMIFSLFHWPCSTTMLTIKKETGSLKWTAVAAILPTILGVSACMLLNVIVRMLS